MLKHAVFSINLKTFSKDIVEYCICAICTRERKGRKTKRIEQEKKTKKYERKIAGWMQKKSKFGR